MADFQMPEWVGRMMNTPAAVSQQYGRWQGQGGGGLLPSGQGAQQSWQTQNIPQGGLLGAGQQPQQPSGVYPTGQPLDYSKNSVWGGNKPLSANSLTNDDRLYLNKMMQIAGGAGSSAVAGMLGGSSDEVLRSLSTMSGQADPYDIRAKVSQFDTSKYNGPAAQYMQAYFAANPSKIPPSYSSNGSTWVFNPATSSYVKR